jgi:hypothetical protein
MPPIAHVGHWLMWVLYAVPVVIVLGSIVVSVIRDRRAEPREAATGSGPAGPPAEHDR